METTLTARAEIPPFVLDLAKDREVLAVAAFTSVEGELLPIRAPEPTMRTDIARLSNGNPDLRYRPEFWPWEIDVPVVFNDLMITEAQVVNLFYHAGFSIGIGDWRLESKNGRYGAFAVKEVKSA